MSKNKMIYGAGGAVLAISFIAFIALAVREDLKDGKASTSQKENVGGTPAKSAPAKKQNTTVGREDYESGIAL